MTSSHPCGYKYQDYVDLGAVQPWDTSLIPNFSQLNPKLTGSGVIDGQQYFIPLDWGFIAPLVNLDHVDPTEESFGILFDDRYAGKISWVDTIHMLIVAGMLHGVSDPFDMTDDELAEMRDFLISKKGLVKFLWNQSFDFWRSFKQEEVWIGYSWPDTVGYADAAGMNYLYMEPKEGRISWVCGMGMFADTQNYHHAHEYVNSWASTKAAEFLLGYYYYGHTNTEADPSVASAGRRRGPRARRSDGAGPAAGYPRELHPASQRLPAVLERGPGGLSRRALGREERSWRPLRPPLPPPPPPRRAGGGEIGAAPRGCSAARCCGCCCSS